MPREVTDHDFSLALLALTALRGTLRGQRAMALVAINRQSPDNAAKRGILRPWSADSNLDAHGFGAGQLALAR